MIKSSACPQCFKDRTKDEMLQINGSARCVYCVESSEPSFVERSILTYNNARVAGKEVGIDADMAQMAFDNAVERISRRYGIKWKNR